MPFFPKPEKRKKRKRKEREESWEEYERLSKEFLSDNPRCAVFPGRASCEIHHMAGRGKFLLDTTTWLAVSREGHEVIHRFPKWAREKGFMLSRHERKDQ